MRDRDVFLSPLAFKAGHRHLIQLRQDGLTNLKQTCDLKKEKAYNTIQINNRLTSRKA